MRGDNDMYKQVEFTCRYCGGAETSHSPVSVRNRVCKLCARRHNHMYSALRKSTTESGEVVPNEKLQKIIRHYKKKQAEGQKIPGRLKEWIK